MTDHPTLSQPKRPAMGRLTYTSNALPNVWIEVVPWKPEGRGRKFRRQARGLARRMRIPWVRSTLAERDNPNSPNHAISYGPMWTSSNALANYSFACTCHPNERYSRKRKHKNR